MRADPSLGASARDLGGGVVEVSVLSRGDRVRARIARARDPRAPVILLGAPEGAATSPFAAAALHAWSGFATVAALDVPLCGARRSDKLSDDAFRERGALATRLRSDLEAQLGADLSRVLDWLEPEPGALGPAAWVALGRAARFEPHPLDLRVRATFRATSPARAKLARFDPSPRNLEALATAIRHELGVD